MMQRQEVIVDAAGGVEIAIHAVATCLQRLQRLHPPLSKTRTC